MLETNSWMNYIYSGYTAVTHLKMSCLTVILHKSTAIQVQGCSVN